MCLAFPSQTCAVWGSFKKIAVKLQSPWFQKVHRARCYLYSQAFSALCRVALDGGLEDWSESTEPSWLINWSAQHLRPATKIKSGLFARWKYCEAICRHPARQSIAWHVCWWRYPEDLTFRPSNCHPDHKEPRLPGAMAPVLPKLSPYRHPVSVSGYWHQFFDSLSHAGWFLPPVRSVRKM